MTRLPAPPAALLAAVLTVLLGVVLTACGDSDDRPAPRPTSAAPPPVASAVPKPDAAGCAKLTYQQAVAPTLAAQAAVPCSASHTSETYAVGTLSTSTVVDGHLLAVDSAKAQAQVAQKCPAGLAAYLGGDQEALRLSMLRAVWFTPTVSQAEAGADWYRCDVIALAGDQQLATLSGSLKGVLGPGGNDDWAMCGTAQPGTAGFKRVPCRADHSWKALETVDLPAGGYPGAGSVKQAGQKPCQAAAKAVASDALDYQWGYEWPTAAQWKSGQTYGICWAPTK